MSERHGGSAAGGQQQVPLVAVALTAAAAGAIGVSIVYWHTQRHRSAGAAANSRTSNGRKADSRWPFTWPWSKTTSLTAMAAAAAAERLSALARSSEAIESAAKIPLDKTSSLASLASGRQQSGGSGGEGPAPEKFFSEADLPRLVYCTRKNGAREVLGSGTAGQVYKALRGGNTPIAVREFRYQLSDVEMGQLQALIARMQRCDDKNVVKLLGCAPIPGPGGGLLIAAPFFEGGSLQDLLNGPHRSSLTWLRPARPGKSQQAGPAQRVLLAVARGLDWLHKHGVIHQNLCPSKVLLGDGGEAKVGDAGLAPFTHPDYQAAVSNCGPFAWTAPELMWGCPATPSSDVYSFGVLLWQLVTGNDPVIERRRFVKPGPNTCPQAITDLIVQCLDRNAAARPSAGEIVALLSRSPSALPPALRPRPKNWPFAGAPIHGGKQAVWEGIQSWVYISFGSKEKAHAAGYVESIPEKILDAREWDAYKEYAEGLMWAMSQPDVEEYGTKAYKRLMELHRSYAWCVYSKLFMTFAAVREQRFAQMEDLASLEALARPAEEGLADEDTLRRSSGNSRGSGHVTHSMSSEDSDGSNDSNSMAKRYLKRLQIINLTKEQLDATLLAHKNFKAAQRELVLERNILVKILHDFAVGAAFDHEQALRASTQLRANIMEEGRQLHSMHCWWMWELLSPWQNARSEIHAYPYLSDPMLLVELAVARAKGDSGRNVADFSWIPMMNEGHFSELKCDLDLIIRNDK